MKDPTGRRLGDRTPTRMAAKIIDDAGCVTNVSLRDISPSGARIETGYGAVIPRRFVLRLARDGRDCRVELVWRNGVEAGVRFIREDAPVAAPPPRPVAVAPAARVSLADLRKLAMTAKR